MADNRKTVTLSEHLGVTSDKLEELGVLNTSLGIDLKLFIDPKLIRSSSAPELADAGDAIGDYFNKLLSIFIQVDRSPRLARMAIEMIAIKEPKGLSIGYGDKRDTGTSISQSVANDSLRSLHEMLSVGYRDITVMEMLGLFIKGFGADSISDLTSHIVYDRLCSYTQRISKDNGFTTEEFEINGKEYYLPKNPFKGTQIVFVPLDILSTLPIAASWEDVAAAAAANESVRQSFNDIVGDNIKGFASKVKRDPIMLMKSIEAMETIVDTYKEAEVKPYSISEDPSGYLRLQAYSDEISGTISPISEDFSSIADVHGLVVNTIIPHYRRHIVDLGANKLLYKRVGSNLQKVDDTSPVHEDASQVLFHIVADQVCKESNVMLSRESTTSPGAVDFSLGTGYDNKVVVEIKKSTNKNLLNGYEKQVLAYEKAEAAKSSVYVVVIVRKSNVDNPESQLNQLKALHAKKLSEGKVVPDLHIVDGLIYDSASKL